MEVFDQGASFAEARLWAVWLGRESVFTERELAQSMMISEELAARFCVALLHHRHDGQPTPLIRVVEEFENGNGLERIYEMVPLPPGPRFHPHQLPEWRSTPGAYEDAPARGLPVAGTSGVGTQGVRKAQRSIVAGGRRNRKQ